MDDTMRFPSPPRMMVGAPAISVRSKLPWIAAGLLLILLAGTATGLIIYRGQAMNLRKIEAQTHATLVKTQSTLATTEGDRARIESRLSLMTTTASQGVRGYGDCQRASKLSLAADNAFNNWFYENYFSDYLWQRWRSIDRRAIAARETCLIGQVPRMP